jgi:hypothetical protein
VTFLLAGIHWVMAIQRPLALLLVLVLLAALVYCGGLILRSLLRSRAVSANEILGTLSLYLIIGLIWAFIYSLLEALVPGSFGSASPIFTSEQTSPFVYFSFVTQASLGYGDITPQMPLASRLVVVHAVMGQFYVAVVVAYLISVFIQQRRTGHK